MSPPPKLQPKVPVSVHLPALHASTLAQNAPKLGHRVRGVLSATNNADTLRQRVTARSHLPLTFG
jgi:hypothetical protein